MGRYNREFGRSLRGFSEAAALAIDAHNWPGNVRELENRVKRGVVMAEGTLIHAADLEFEADAAPGLPLDLRMARLRAEREVLGQALARGGGKMSQVARLLGVSRPTLYDLLETHGLQPPALARPLATAVGDDDPSSTDPE
jgi:two-component system NtrC family response regulator